MLHFLLDAGIGLFIAAPPGPVGIYCIHRTLTHGWRAGLLAGLGAATADALCGVLAASGSSALSVFVHTHVQLMQWVGCAALLLFGTLMLLLPPRQREANCTPASHLGAYGATFVLTIASPVTFLSFCAAYNAVYWNLNLQMVSNVTAASQLTVAVFFGSTCWWLLLSAIVSVLRRPLTDRQRLLLNRIAGLGMIAFALVLLVRSFWR